MAASFDVKTDLNMNTHKITNVVDPTNDQDAATKKYVDDNAGGGGVDSIAKSGDTPLTGDVTLSEGSNITLTQTGQDIEIAASGSGGGAPDDATYITQTANAGLSAEQALSALATGIVKVTTTTGVLSTATPDTDYVKDIGVVTHAATGKATPVDADEFPISDSAASNILKKLSGTDLKAYLKTYFDTLYTGSGTGIPTDGWVAAADTWTYASGSGGGTATFTISGVDRTAIFTPGTRIKLTQTTAKYFVVASSSFSTNTTVTITAGSDYTLANAAITSPYYSHIMSPEGYPGWFAWAPTIVGWTTPVATCRFQVVGRQVTFQFTVTASASNSAATTFTLPIAATYTGLPFMSGNLIKNNSGSYTQGRWYLSSSTVVTVGLSATSDTWTASGNKEVNISGFYEI